MKTKLTLFLLFIAYLTSYSQVTSLQTEKIHLKVGVSEQDPNAEDTWKNAPKSYALIIGVSEYKNASSSLTNLQEPVNDAQKLYNVLLSRYRFSADDIIFLKNPTRGEILENLETLAHKVTEKENLLVFYAGHGWFDAKLNVGYWIASDAIPGKSYSYLSNTQLRDYLKGIPSKHTLLISDACFGGAIFASSRGVLSTDDRMQFTDVYKYKSRKALTSGNLTEVPDQSVFIKYLIKVLEEYNDKSFLSAQTLFNKIYDPIQNNSRQLPQYGAIQDAGDEGVAGAFVFLRND